MDRRWARVCSLAVACEVALSSVVRARRRRVRSGLVATAVLFVSWAGSAVLVLVVVGLWWVRLWLGVRRVVALGMLGVYMWGEFRWGNRGPMQSGWLGRLGRVWRVRKGLQMCL